MTLLILSCVLAFSVTQMSTPSIIQLALRNNLLDIPDFRKSHDSPTPSIGGVGIFIGFCASIFFFIPAEDFAVLKYILLALLIIFSLGIRDDLFPLSPLSKLMGQLVAVSILIFLADLRFTGFYGLWNLGELGYVSSVILSFLLYIFLINSFNLLDGIDGLCASIVIFILSILGVWFYISDHLLYALLSFATIGSTFSFLRFNISPAKIFMGDSGSLVLGAICAICCNKALSISPAILDLNFGQHVPAILLSLFILPVLDTSRVFLLRIMRGQSPFLPDNNHIHHLLLKLGLTHMQATAALLGSNILIFLLVVRLHEINTNFVFSLIVGLAILLSQLLHLSVYLKNRKAIQS